MALSTTQVQQVFLAITGRPAEGQAVAWGANSLNIAALANSVIDIRKGTDFANNKDTFIENLYQNLLGRASDAEGKEFWLKVLNDGASYGDVVAQFINAVLVQSQTADLYTLENKLGIAEQISAQIPSFTGSEANLVQIMSNVSADTKIEELSNDIENFKGQNVNVANVSVNTKADNNTATEGSEEHASVFNATVSILDNQINSDESTLLINGSTNYNDTLNLTLKASKDAKGKQDNVDLGNVISGVQNIDAINLDVKDNNIAGVSGAVTAFNLKIDGTSKDTISVSGGKTVDTGAGNDTITVNGAATVIAGAGNDQITIAAANTTISIDGGAGRDTVTLSGDNTKVSLTNVEVLNTSAAATVSKTLLDGKSYDLINANVITVSAENGIDLSKMKVVTDQTSSGFAINDVASGTVKLSAKDAGITETITLGANAEKVTITGFAGTKTATSDKINFATALGGAADFAGTEGGNKALAAAPATAVGVADKKAYVLNYNGNKDVSKLLLSDLDTALGKGTAANTKALIAVTKNDDDKDLTAFYLVDASQAAIIGVKLLGTIDQDVQVGDTFQNSTFGGSQ